MRFEPLRDDFLHNVGRRHEAELHVGILHQEARRLFPFE